MRSIRWKYLLLTFFVVFIPIYYLNQYAIRSFDHFSSKALEQEMIGHASIFAEQYKSMVLESVHGIVREPSKEFSEMLQTYGASVQSDMKIISPKGIVLFESDPYSPPGEDLSSLPEVQKAMNGIYKARWKLTEDKAFVYYYCAVPIMHDDSVVGIAYISRHTGQITNAITKISFDQHYAMILALVSAALASIILSQTMTYRLRKLTRASKEYAIGNEPLNLQIKGRDEIGVLGEAVKNMATEIEKRNDYNREFMSAVIHELRTPVTAIKGAAEILKAGAIDKEESRTKFIANIQFETERLAKLIGELNELTKLDAEDLRGHKETLDYREAISQILDRLMPTFDQKHAEFKTSLPENKIVVMISPGRIEQVISNLLENAFRYTPTSGTVELIVSQPDSKTVLTTVADTGQGIPDSNIENIFNKFYTTEKKGVAREYGSGLGLAIAKSIIENHHGSITAESPQNKGTSIKFTLPTAS